jgi:hypothetical protein
MAEVGVGRGEELTIVVVGGKDGDARDDLGWIGGCERRGPRAAPLVDTPAGFPLMSRANAKSGQPGAGR